MARSGVCTAFTPAGITLIQMGVSLSMVLIRGIVWRNTVCGHRHKVYSRMHFATHNGSRNWHWVCADCRETGTDYDRDKPAGMVDERRYCQLTGAYYYLDAKKT